MKYFLECYQFDEAELNKILRVAFATNECQQIIRNIKGQNGRNSNHNTVEQDGYVKEYHIDSFSALTTLKGAKIKEHDELEQRIQTRSQKIARLKALAKAYSECEVYKAVAEESGSLSGLKKLKFDKEHEQDLSMYCAKRKKLTALLNREKITPKAWRSECDTLIKEQQNDERNMAGKRWRLPLHRYLKIIISSWYLWKKMRAINRAELHSVEKGRRFEKSIEKSAILW